VLAAVSCERLQSIGANVLARKESDAMATPVTVYSNIG